jgi:hypothetical protein
MARAAAQESGMRYDQLSYVPESADPSITIETGELVIKVIDNTGLALPPNPERKSYFGSYGYHEFVPFTHHLGYHGIRTLYSKSEKRNVVVPFVSWLNLQNLKLEGIETDPVDERAWSGVARGWPIRMERKGLGARLTLDPLPQTQFRYTIEFQPAEPDGVDFAIRFAFGLRPASRPVCAKFTWPCYMNAYDDVRFFFPKATATGGLEWTALGEKPDIVIGDPAGYEHDMTWFQAEGQALPVGYGRIGDRALTIMFSDPKVRFFVVNSGGHFSCLPVQNPAWDFEYVIEDYPLNEEVGFDGRLVYSRFESAEHVLRRYESWKHARR